MYNHDTTAAAHEHAVTVVIFYLIIFAFMIFFCDYIFLASKVRFSMS